MFVIIVADYKKAQRCCGPFNSTEGAGKALHEAGVVIRGKTGEGSKECQ